MQKYPNIAEIISCEARMSPFCVSPLLAGGCRVYLDLTRWICLLIDLYGLGKADQPTVGYESQAIFKGFIKTLNVVERKQSQFFVSYNLSGMA